MLAADAAPAVEPGGQCGHPYECEFWDACTAQKPADWVAYLPRLQAGKAADLAARGIDSISSIPEEYPLTWKQAVIRDVLRTGRPHVAPDLARLLDGFGPPACYLDFEAMMPPVPLYEGTRPYQTLPFQWSLHSMRAGGGLTHRAFLAAHDRDPRRSFVETLIAPLSGSEDPALVYSSYEKTRLRERVTVFLDLAAPIGAIVERLVDLLPVIRGAIYFPDFDFSHSIKTVAPALCPGFGYSDLNVIADGGAAAAAFLRMACGEVDDPAPLRTALEAYCARDTLAMVEVHRLLMRLAG